MLANWIWYLLCLLLRITPPVYNDDTHSATMAAVRETFEDIMSSDT